MKNLKKLTPQMLAGKKKDEVDALLIEEAIRLGFVKGLVLTTKPRGRDHLTTKTLNGNYRISGHSDISDVWTSLTVWAQTEEDPIWGVPLFINEKALFCVDHPCGNEIPWILYDYDCIPAPQTEQSSSQVRLWSNLKTFFTNMLKRNHVRINQYKTTD